MIVPFFGLGYFFQNLGDFFQSSGHPAPIREGSTLPSNNRLGCEGFQGTHSSFHVHCITDTGENVL
jgi:hypothetical protein